MLKNKLKVLTILLVLIPVFFVFKQILFEDLQTFGDAPFFYKDVIPSLFSEPRAWTERGINFGGINQILWISPIMFIYGALAHFFGLDNSAIIRILFYFPAIISSIIGPYLLAKYLKLSNVTIFFSCLVYSLNTYFILLIDGGQVGIALAYGLFPILLLAYKKLVDKPTELTVLIAFISSVVYCFIDPRVYAILMLLVVLWSILERKRIVLVMILQIPIVLSNLYWLYPLIKSESTSVSTSLVSLQTSSLLNALLLYAPHWPNNAFGKIESPSFYFAFVPFLLVGSYFFISKHKALKTIGILFLFFLFLSKGSTPPLGSLYGFLVNKFPLGSAFRDSSKFFIPIILLASLMIGETLSLLKNNLVRTLSYLFLLLLVWQALFVRLNFNLSNRVTNNDFSLIADRIQLEGKYYRTAWFTAKDPMSYESSQNPAIDSRELVKMKSLEVINASEDPFNFINNLDFPNRLARLGVKYLILSGDSRNINSNETELKNWNIITKLISENKNIKKVDWNTEFSIYETSNVLPKFYKVNSLVGVVGPYLNKNASAIYFEDGKFDPNLLADKNPNALKLFFNKKNDIDLQFSFLQKYFVSTSEAVANNWAYYPSSNILKVKYELLIRDIKYNDFDYSRGVSFSTKKGETVNFKLNVPTDGDYILATRAMVRDSGFEWEIVNSSLTLKKGVFDYEFENDREFKALNVVALIPKKEFDDSLVTTKKFINTFGIIKNEPNDNDFEQIEIIGEGTALYKFTPNKSGYWLVLNDSYNPLWVMRKGVEYFKSVPINSEVNGFYFEPKWNDLHIEFDGQKYFRWGLYYSLVTILGTLIILLIKYEKNN